MRRYFTGQGRFLEDDLEILLREGEKLEGRRGHYKLVSKIFHGYNFCFKAVEEGENRFLKVQMPEDYTQKYHEAEVHALGKLAGRRGVPQFIDREKPAMHPFVVTDYKQGSTLRKKIDGGKLALGEAKRIFTGVCDSMSEIHENGIIHRDIKPENILICNDGTIVIVDFGICYFDGLDEDESLVLGTPYFISPEQALGGFKPTPRSDIYGLGVTIWNAITNKYPFEGSFTGIYEIHADLSRKAPNPKTTNPDITDELAEIILKALEKNPDKRFQSALELKKALESI